MSEPSPSPDRDQLAATEEAADATTIAGIIRPFASTEAVALVAAALAPWVSARVAQAVSEERERASKAILALKVGWADNREEDMFRGAYNQGCDDAAGIAGGEGEQG